MVPRCCPPPALCPTCPEQCLALSKHSINNHSVELKGLCLHVFLSPLSLPFHSLFPTGLVTGEQTGWAQRPSVCLGPHFPSVLQPSRMAPGFVLPSSSASFPLEPYTCGACGIQFQFYNNLLEHMQSHAGKRQQPPGSCRPQRHSQNLF